MAETLLSPGVLTRENDSSQVTQGPEEFGAAIIGPAAKGPLTPTVVTSYSQYVALYGTTVEHDSNVYSYLTSIAVSNYFQNGGRSVLMTRVAPGSHKGAGDLGARLPSSASINALVPTNSVLATVDIDVSGWQDDTAVRIDNSVLGISAIFIPNGATNVEGLYSFSQVNGSFVEGLVAAINNNLAIHLLASLSGSTLTLTAQSPSADYNSTTFKIASGPDAISDILNDSVNPLATLTGGTPGTVSPAFVLETFSFGTDQNSAALGTDENIKVEITSPSSSNGTFNLLVRRGDDTDENKIILESYDNLSLDPYSINYISKRIGDLKEVISNDDGYYINYTGTYPNISNYIRVKSVDSRTPNYTSSNSDSLPIAQTALFSGGQGDLFDASVDGGAPKFYSNITDTNNQGLNPSGDEYTLAIGLLENKEEFKFNVISAPGIFNTGDSSATVTLLKDLAISRGDCIYVADLVPYNSQLNAVVTAVSSLNSSYTAAYWGGWLQTIDVNTGEYVFVPESTLIPGVYAYTDASSEPWFAPAGLTRGGLGSVIRAGRKLTASHRDTLYTANVNPIATFPGQGIAVYGQKTTQKSASALDRVNVRRLLIELKSYIGQIANTLVFDQNTAATRHSFLAIVNPYLESIQQRQGLYAFKVKMDDTNNTAEVIDRNELVGAIYLQPTKTAEFIKLDFNVLPTGATFPQ